jgi:hypothetical protein
MCLRRMRSSWGSPASAWLLALPEQQEAHLAIKIRGQIAIKVTVPALFLMGP